MIAFANQGFFAADRDFFKELLVYNSVRGKDSTGIFGGQWRKSPDYIKSTGNPYDLFNNKQTEDFFRRIMSKYKFVVGHGRWATRGLISSANAHPFQVGDITMVHNGTVNTSSHVKTLQHDVDSLALAHALNEHPYEEIIPEINGAFAMAWHDKRDQKIRIVRNSERPLFLAKNELDKQYIFASEGNMMALAAGRNKIKLTDMMLLPEYTVFEFENNKFSYEKVEVPKKIWHTPTYSTPAKETPPFQVKDNVIKLVDKEKQLISITSDTGIKFDLNGEVHFFITDTVCLSKRNDKEIIQVFGTACNAPEMEVVFVDKSNTDTIYTADFCTGTIQNIIPVKNKETPNVTHRLFVNNVQFNSVVVDSSNTPYTKEEFIEHTKEGCNSCGALIKLEDAENSLILDDYCLCHKCVQAAEDLQVEPQSLVH